MELGEGKGELSWGSPFFFWAWWQGVEGWVVVSADFGFEVRNYFDLNEPF